MTREQYQYQEWRKRYIARHEKRGCPPELMARILDAERDHQWIRPPEPGAWVCSTLDWKVSGYIIERGSIGLKHGFDFPVFKVYSPEYFQKPIQIIPVDMIKGYG